MTFKDKLIVWVYHKSSRLEDESEQLRQSLRRYPADSLDLYEIMRQKIRIAAWQEFLDELFKLLFGTSGE